jgi:hypothetical protein
MSEQQINDRTSFLLGNDDYGESQPAVLALSDALWVSTATKELSETILSAALAWRNWRRRRRKRRRRRQRSRECPD